MLHAAEYLMDPTGDDIDSGPRLEDLWIENQPSVSIDRLVIKRESWRFPPTELEFAHVLDPAQRFLRARN